MAGCFLRRLSLAAFKEGWSRLSSISESVLMFAPFYTLYGVVPVAVGMDRD